MNTRIIFGALAFCVLASCRTTSEVSQLEAARPVAIKDPVQFEKIKADLTSTGLHVASKIELSQLPAFFATQVKSVNTIFSHGGFLKKFEAYQKSIPQGTYAFFYGSSITSKECSLEKGCSLDLASLEYSLQNSEISDSLIWRLSITGDSATVTTVRKKDNSSGYSKTLKKLKDSGFVVESGINFEVLKQSLADQQKRLINATSNQEFMAAIQKLDPSAKGVYASSFLGVATSSTCNSGGLCDHYFDVISKNRVGTHYMILARISASPVGPKPIVTVFQK